MRLITVAIIFAAVIALTNHASMGPQDNSISMPVENKLPTIQFPSDQIPNKEEIRAQHPIPNPLTIIVAPGPNQPITIEGPKKVHESEMPSIPRKKKLTADSYQDLPRLLPFNVLEPEKLPGSYGSPLFAVTEKSVNVIYTNAEGAKLSIYQMMSPQQDENMEQMPMVVDEHGAVDGKHGRMNWHKIGERYTISWQAGAVHYSVSGPTLQECIATEEVLMPVQ